ncbi:MAG: aldo/keto reductase [Alphaproteobacteria bacterium]|nr:aldo/keto reductase [Alphaproteobacteria bacterium]
MALDRYFTLGRSGLRVSPLALGTMTFGEDWGWGSDEKTSRRIFDAYLAAGGNFIDTADLYTGGHSEELVGKFVAETKSRDRVVIATKFSYNGEAGNPNAGGNGRKAMIRAVEGSLRRLRTDAIDLYLLHTWDRITPAEEVLETFDLLVAAGKIRHAGLSDVPAWYATQMAMLSRAQGRQRVVNLQLQYSLVERSIEREFVDLALEFGMGITSWSPLAMGLLTGRYRPEDADGGGRLHTLKSSGIAAISDKFTERNWAIVAALRRIAAEAGRSMSQVAIQWAARRPAIGAVIIGARTAEQLADNLAALDSPLADAQLAALDRVAALPMQFPYSFFAQDQQARIHGGVAVGDKPDGYAAPVRIAGQAAAGPGVAPAKG